MKFSLLLSAPLVSLVTAAYPGDIVQYWVDRSAILVNGTIIGGLQSPPSGWFEAATQGAVYYAALQARNGTLAFQQLAVSHAAHDVLVWVFHGTRLYATIDAQLAAISPAIGLNETTSEGRQAIQIGRQAARKVITARSDDGINYYVPYSAGPAYPGIYQATPGGSQIPDTPQAAGIKLFAGLGDVTKFRVAPPPSVNGSDYEKYVQYVKSIGNRNSTTRTAEQTKSAYIWRESSPIGWNRFLTLIIGNKYATDVVKSAKIYAQLNYALANAAIASWDSKFAYRAWRPVTAIQRTDIWLSSKTNVSDPTWTPLLTPTPNHPDYTSTHSVFGGAAGYVIRQINGGDAIDIQYSSNVTVDNIGVLTRRYTNISQAVYDNAYSRVYGGIHFEYASVVGAASGAQVANATLAVFDHKWDQF